MTSPNLTEGERRRSLAAAIASIGMFGVSIGLGNPLLSLLLQARGTDPSLTGLNAAGAFIGVMLGPLLAPRLVARFGFKHLLLAALPLSYGFFLLLKPFPDYLVWFVLRLLEGTVGSAVFAATEAWISLLAGDRGRGRVIGLYGAALSAGFAAGPLILSLTGIMGWAPFLARGVLVVLAMVPLLFVAADHGRIAERGGHPLAMIARMPLIVLTVILFSLYEGATVALLPVWGARVGFDFDFAAALLTAIYVGSIALQIPVGWLSDWIDRRFALRLCGVVGLIGAAAIPLLARTPGLLLVALFLWGGFATSIYPIALSGMGDRFRGADLVNANAALVMAYGTGAVIGPILGGAAMDAWDPHGLILLLGAIFAVLLVTTLWRGGIAPPIPASSPETRR